MTKHIEIAERMARLNPVPDPTVVDESRLAALASLVEQRRSNMIETRPAASEVEPPVRGRRALAFASALVLVILVIGAVALLRDADTVDITDEPAPTTIPATTLESAPTTTVVPDSTAAPTVTPTTTAVPVTPARLEMTLQQVPTQPAFGRDDVVNSVIEGGPGLIAVGGEFSDESGPQAVVWTSVDGFTWQRAAVPPFKDSLIDVALGPAGFVAVSPEWPPPRHPFDPIPTTVAPAGAPGILFSADGESWARIPQDEAVFPAGEAHPSAVTAGGPGYVAVGRVAAVDPVGRYDRQPAIWTSVDGVSWERVEQPPEEAYLAFATDIVNTSSGLVAVGGLCSTDNDDSCAALVWTSTDGQVWDRQVLPGEAAEASAVKTHGEGVVVFGQLQVSPRSEVAWFATDPTGPFSLQTMPTLWPTDVISDGDRLLGFDRGLAWASQDDGATWYEAAVEAGAAGWWGAVTAFGDGFVFVGGTGDGTAPVWIGTWNED